MGFTILHSRGKVPIVDVGVSLALRSSRGAQLLAEEIVSKDTRRRTTDATSPREVNRPRQVFFVVIRDLDRQFDSNTDDNLLQGK